MNRILARRAQVIFVAVGIGWALTFPTMSLTLTNELLGYDLFILMCTLVALVATLRMPRDRRLPWALLTGGLTLFLVGELLWASYDWRGLEPWPSLADVASLAAYVPLGVCAALLSRPQTPLRDRYVWLDAAILTLVLGAAVWIVLINPYAADPDLSVVEKAWLIAYPVADIFVLGFVLRIVLSPRGQTRAAMIFAAGMICMLVGDTWFGWIELNELDYGQGAVVDTWWMVGYVFMAASALDRTAGDFPEPEEDDGIGRARLALVILALIAPTLAVLWGLHETEGMGATTAGVGATIGLVVSVLVAVRLWSLMRRARALETHRGAQRLSAVVHHSSDAIVLVSADGTISYASPAVTQWGHDADSIVGQPLASLMTATDRSGLTKQLASVSASPEGTVLEMRGRIESSGGVGRSVEGTMRNLLLDPAVESVVVTIHDVTERQELEAQLRRKAFQDDLTGLANRELFSDRLAHALNRSGRREEVGVAVLFLDLDDFKSVNDGLGHSAGDDLLRHVADRIRVCVRPGDTVARLGGDEFAILLEDLVDLEEAGCVAQRILEVLALPVRVLSSDITVPASIGLAPRSPGCTVESLLRDADIAMYSAKAFGKCRLEVFDDGLRQAAQRRLQLRCDLPAGLQAGDFRVVYQPVNRIDDHVTVGFEALLRWEHPRHGPISPEEFIPAAESSGFIVELGRWVLTEACAQAAQWNRISPVPLTMNVNVSGVQLQHGGFPDLVADVLQSTGLDPSLLTVELTESVLVDTRIGLILGELRDLGVGIAIDDFGTGYSSLAYLNSFPISTVKIDRQFISDLNDEEDPSLVRSVLGIAEALGLKAIAEGVETTEQFDALEALGCPLVQGYYLGRPAAPDTLESLVAGGERVAIV